MSNQVVGEYLEEYLGNIDHFGNSAKKCELHKALASLDNTFFPKGQTKQCQWSLPYIM